MASIPTASSRPAARAQLREAIDRALGGIEYFCFEVWGKARANADARARALEDAGRLVSKIDNPIKRDLVIDTLAKALEIDPNVVRGAVARGSGRGSYAAGSRPRDGHPNAPSGPEAGPDAAPRKVAAPPIEEVEVITLLTDHPALIASPEADKAFWLLTDETLRAMYSAARDGQSFLELAPVQLPPPTAKLVLSGKYSDHKDPRGQLVAMTQGLEQRKQALETAGLQKHLAAAKRGTVDKELVRLQARLAEAQRRGDRELADRLAGEISSNRKQAE